MSFSGKIKEELSGQYPRARHCKLAELSGITGFSGINLPEEGEEAKICFRTENGDLARKYFTLLTKTFNIKADIAVRKLAAGHQYRIFARENGLHAIFKAQIQSPCCKRGYIRGAFLAAGSMSDPRKSYHFEVVAEREADAVTLQNAMNHFGLDAKVIYRKKAYVVYLKEGTQIADVLNIMGASVALMEFENIRILKEMRNTVNRKVNCETANINKTVSAAVKQNEDIRYIRDTIGLDDLPESLCEMAKVRLSYPEASLKELGQLLPTPIGKSGVNHRLRKLGEMAEALRARQGGAIYDD